MDKRENLRRSSGGEKRAYSRPTLRDFGPVGKLTQAGTGPSTEGVIFFMMSTMRNVRN